MAPSTLPPALLLLFACGGAADSGGDSAPGDMNVLTLDDLGGVCDEASRWGGFSVEADESYALVTGIVRDGVIPADVLDKVTTSGECTLWRRSNPYCNPGCESDQTCDDDGECVPFPLGQDLGTVTLRGLLEPVAMDPVEPDQSYFDTSIPNPPWQEGAVVALTAGALVLEGVGLSGFTPNETAWTLTSDAPLAVTWSVPSAGSLSTVHLELTIDQHGSTPLMLTCEFVDDGSGEVPADLVGQMVTSGVTGYPNGRLGRRTADHAPWGGGCVDLVLTQPRAIDVTVSGFYPCTTDDQCPDGLTCDEEQEVCT